MGVQVDLATHKRDGEGNLIPLSINKRQFISFSYGGKNIEDFDLLAVFSNDRLDKEIYFSFNDIISKNEAVDGQIFWNSVFNAGVLRFNLATDGMTSENYEIFKNHFIPGEAKELVLSEFPNRAILARVAAPPQISLLPFEDKKKFIIAGQEKEISTSLYKGDISLEFVMDDPYWYSLQSCVNDTLDDYQYSDIDLKIIYEDKIPSLKMFPADENIFLLGDGTAIQNQSIIKDYSVNLTPETTNLFLYNCSTAPARSILSFNFKPIFEENSYFVLSPSNSYIQEEYSSFTVGNQTLQFTTPSLLTSYNHALTLVENIETGSSILDLRQKVRDGLHNYYTRAWAIAIIDGLKDNNTYVDSAGAILDKESFRIFFSTLMQVCFKDSVIECTVDSKIGEVKIKTTCKVATKKIDSLEAAQGMANVSIEENAGDMIKSKYLKLEDRTIFNSETGLITADDCLKISSDCTLTDLKINFKYTYL